MLAVRHVLHVSNCRSDTEPNEQSASTSWWACPRSVITIQLRKPPTIAVANENRNAGGRLSCL